MSKSGTTELKEVIGSLKAGGREFPLISVKYLLQINNWPTILAELLVKGYNNETRAIEVDKSLLEELKLIKDNKEEITIEFGTKDVEGNNDTVNLSCLVKSVAMSFTSSDVYLSVVLAPKYVSMDSLNLSVFKRVSKVIDIDASDAYDLTKTLDNKLMSYVHLVYLLLKNEWETKMGDIIEKCPEIEKITLTNILKNNAGLYGYFDKLLTNSIETVGTLYQIKDNFDKKAYNVPQSIKNKISEEKGSFLSNIMEVAALYCLIYVPNPTSGDDPGYYIPSSNIWDTEVENSPMTVVGVSVNVGGLGLPELGFIYTKGSANFDLDASYLFRWAIDACAMFPDSEDAKNKAGLSVSPPAALPIYKRKLDGGSSTNDPTTKSGQSLLSGDTVDEVKKKTTSVLLEWCRLHYSLQKAMTNTATIETFFSANPSCFGKRVKIVDNNGAPILEGFVSGYELYIKKDLGSSGTAITKLALTGVVLL